MNIDEMIKNCNKCGTLPKLACNSVQMGKVPILIIGESPATNGWIESGRAFYNVKGNLQASGKTLSKLLELVELKIEDIYFTEFCKCIIKDRKNLVKSCLNCKEILNLQIQNLPVKILMPMGLFPTQALLSQKIKKFGDYVGKIIPLIVEGEEYLVIPIYHPSPANPLCYKGNVEIFNKLKNLI